MFYIYSFHFRIIDILLFSIQKQSNGGFPLFLKISQNSQKITCARVSFSRVASNFIKEETPAQCFPKPLTIFAKCSIVDVRLGFKHASVLPPDLKPIYKDFLL